MAEKKIGERVRSLRESQNLSREELAKRAGLDLGILTALEEESIAPHLGPLLRLSRALGVRLGTFMDDELGRDFCISRKDECHEDAGIRKPHGRDATMIFHSLGRTKSDRHMEPLLIELHPDPVEDKVLSSHEGEEFIMVLSGELEFRYGNESYVVSAGDSIYYNSVVPHYVGCGKADKAVICAVIYVPDK